MKHSEGNYNKQENNYRKQNSKSILGNLLNRMLTSVSTATDVQPEAKLSTIPEEKSRPEKTPVNIFSPSPSYQDYDTETSIYDWAFVKASYSDSNTCIFIQEITESVGKDNYATNISNDFFTYDQPPVYDNNHGGLSQQNTDIGHAKRDFIDEQWETRKPYIMIIYGMICFYAIVIFLAILIANLVD